MKRALIIDGNNFYNISYYAAQRNGFGEFVAIEFFRRLADAYKFKQYNESSDYDFLFVAWDSSNNLRKKKFPYYKAQRKPKPDGFYDMMPYIKDTLSMRRVQQYEEEGFEGDDIIASLVSMCLEKGYGATIASSDHDMYALLRQNVFVYDALKKIIITEDDFKKEFGINPDQWRYVKALMGDTSDNVDGVKGIGETNALKLIQKYGDFDKMYSSDMNGLTNSIKTKLIKVEQDYDAKKAAYEALELVSFMKLDLKYPENAVIDPIKVNNSIHIGA